MHLNVEIKARTQATDKIRQFLESKKARFKGTDHQKDTYFEVPFGRLKVREGNVENALIHYFRPDQDGPKTSNVTLQVLEKGNQMVAVLSAALPTKVVVEKQRDIYFIENVKFHLDHLPSLGHFVEIEAIDIDGTLGVAYLEEQVEFYLSAFDIERKDLEMVSYSDMLMGK